MSVRKQQKIKQVRKERKITRGRGNSTRRREKREKKILKKYSNI